MGIQQKDNNSAGENMENCEIVLDCWWECKIWKTVQFISNCSPRQLPKKNENMSLGKLAFRYS
jgi:hypothetical protein